MRKALLFLSLIILANCSKEEKVTYALFSGQITNPKGDKLIIYDGSELEKEIDVTSDGTFKDTLFFDTGYYTLVHGRENSTIFFEPGQKLELKLNTDQFDESISYSGEGSASNNYLVKKYLLDERLSGVASETFSLEESEFSSKIEGIYKEKLVLLNSTEDLGEDFKQMELKNLEYEHLTNIQSYPMAHAYYAQKPGFKASDEFLKPLTSLDYNQESDYDKFSYYKRLVQSHYNTLLAQSDSPEDIFEKINTTSFPALKEDLAKNLSYRIGPSNEYNKVYHDGILALTSDDELKQKVKEKYGKMKELAKGMPSPEFVDYENHKGGTMSLKDLKGKYVYVDVWATWCGPCKVEIPHLKEIEERYEGKNIHFVSTSIDKAADHNKWIDMVKEEELGGIQLMADNDWNSEFVKEYAIEGIPRFILIDPEGNIVSADAPRPSNPKLIEMLNGLNI